MKIFQQSNASDATLGKKHALSLVIITVMAMFTVATPSPMILGVPRPFIITLVFTAYMFASLVGRIGFTYWTFVLAYLAAFIPGTLYNMFDVTIKWTSVFQLLPMLVAFCFLGTYFDRWLTRNSDRAKVRWIQRILIYFFVVSVLELIFYGQFATLRAHMYPSSLTDALGALGSEQRELDVYGGRPTALFSEPSNLAKFVSVIVAAYMVVSKCSKRSIAALVVFYLLIRSVSYFYAAPVMALAWWQSHSYRLPGKGGVRFSPVKLIGAALVGICLIAGVLVTQRERLSRAESGNDSSSSGRIGLPLQYMRSHIDTLIVGHGITPQDDLTRFTVLVHAMSVGSMDQFSGTMAATSTTIVILVGTGIVGLATFYIAIYLFQQRRGVWIATVFLVSNILNAGYNSSAAFVLSALLVSLMAYQLRIARIDQRESISAPSVQLEPVAQ